MPSAACFSHLMLCVCSPRRVFGDKRLTLRIIRKLGEFQVYGNWISVEEKELDQANRARCGQTG